MHGIKKTVVFEMVLTCLIHTHIVNAGYAIKVRKTANTAFGLGWVHEGNAGAQRASSSPRPEEGSGWVCSHII